MPSVSVKSLLLFAAALAAAGPARAEPPAACTGEGSAIERVSACTKFIEEGASGDDLVQALMSKATASANLGQMDVAIADLDAALKIAPARQDLWIAKARALYAKQSYDESMIDLGEAIKLDPKNAVPLDLMGRNHYMLGNLELALEFFDKAIDIDPNLYSAFVNRATTLYKLNRLEPAMRDVNSAYLMLPPRDARGRGLLELRAAIENAQLLQQNAVKPATTN